MTEQEDINRILQLMDEGNKHEARMIAARILATFLNNIQRIADAAEANSKPKPLL